MSDSTAAVVRDVGRSLGARLPELVPEMAAMFTDMIPEFRHDGAVQQLMVASTGSNVSTVVDMLCLGISPEDITVPSAAAEYARRFAQHDLSLEALLRAYRLGEHMILQRSVSELQRRELTTGDALAATSRIALLIHGYIDQIIEGLIEIYVSEREQWDARSDAARAAQVRTVLDTPALAISSAEEMLGLNLRGWHTGVVAWTEPGGAETQLRAVGRLLRDVSDRSPMTVWPDAGTVWAWVSSPTLRTLDVDRLVLILSEHPRLRIAVGEPAAGLNGFRTSHREALRARQVAEVGGRDGAQLHRHSELALAGLLVDRLDDLRVWVRRVLGDLALADESMGRLRETVRIFLETNGSYTDTAARMHVHKNTVVYRVRKAEQVIGRPVSQGRLSIEVALLACDQLEMAAEPTRAHRTPAHPDQREGRP